MTTDSMPNLRVADLDGVRTITIDRPEAKNALTTKMRDDLCALLAAADVDPEVRVVVLAAVDPVFTAGVDFKDIDPSFDPARAHTRRNPARALREMRTPVICSVNGACVSGGLEIVLSSSFAIASDRARFADTHARLGVVPTWGLTALLPRAVGVRRAREMSMTGAFVGADEALRIGLVNRVVPHDELAATVATIAAQVVDTDALGEVLKLYRDGEDRTVDESFTAELDLAAGRVFDAADFRDRGRDAASDQRS